MRKVTVGLVVMMMAFSCSTSKKEENKNKVDLQAGTLTIAGLSDTLIIHESACRNCPYEYSTHFDINDSLGLVQLNRIVTTDEMKSKDNKVVNKDLYLLPLKAGRTNIKLYKFYGPKATAADSTRFTVYEVEIKK